jgi:hypothetical protein
VGDGRSPMITVPVGDVSEKNVLRLQIDTPLRTRHHDFYVDNTVPAVNGAVLLGDFAPVYYFNDGEEYLPLPIEDILSEDRQVYLYFNGRKEAFDGKTLRDHMKTHGFGRSLITDKNDSLSNYTRNASGTNNLSVYGRAIQGVGTTVYLQYWTFYAFDPKAGGRPNLGEHALDRERFTLKLDCPNANNTNCTIEEAVFAGHLPDQTLV